MISQNGVAILAVIHFAKMYHEGPPPSLANSMARPGYLSRREGGRYYLQIRLGKTQAALYGRPILRASLKTSDFAEARRRLVDNLGWVQEIIAAPDLEALGQVMSARLQGYAKLGAPTTERSLTERTAYEHQVRHYMVRANERGYAFSRRFESFASNWATLSTKTRPQNDRWPGWTCGAPTSRAVAISRRPMRPAGMPLQLLGWLLLHPIPHRSSRSIRSP